MQSTFCDRCGKKGHFSKVCKSVPSTQTAKSTACNAIRDTDVDRFSIFAVGNSLHSFDINIDGVTMQCIADTDTQLNIIPKSCIRHHALHATSVELTAYGGNKLTVVGTCILPVAYKNINTTARFYVVQTQATDKPLLSTELCEALGLLNDLIQSPTTANVKRNNRFGYIKNKEYKISIDETVLAVRIPPRRMPPALLSPISAKLKEMENADIIHPVHDFKWSSPLVPVI